MAVTFKNTLLKNTLIRPITIEDYGVSAPKINIDWTDFSTITFGNGTFVSGGADKSGNGTDCEQSDENFQGTYIPNALNGKSGVSFGYLDNLFFGINKFGSGDDPYTFIVASKMSGDSTSSIYFWNSSQAYDGGGIMLQRFTGMRTSWWNDDFVGGALNNDDFFILDTYYDQARRGHYLNNVDVGSEAKTGKNTDNTKNCRLSGGNSGDIQIMLEFMYWDKALTVQEHQNAYRYFNDKLGII